MKKTLFTVFSLTIFSISSPPAQALQQLSGIYEHLILGVDPTQGLVTGYYRQVFEPPNLPYLECSFYLSGRKNGATYEVRAWSPQNKKPKTTTGKLSFFSAENQRPSILLKLDKLSRDCSALKPNLAKEQGAYLDLEKSGSWTEVRMVATKSSYYQAPSPSAPTRDSAKRGTVLTIAERQSDWIQVQEDQKTKGWIRESDLYPTSPSEPAGEPQASVAEKPTATSAKIIPPAVVSTKQSELSSPLLKPMSQLESQALTLDRLKTLSEQAFEMAQQVLKNPAQRNTLSAKRIEMQKDLNGLVTQLNLFSVSSYVDQSKEIFQTFLDLQYVEQDQAVVSLRLHKVIRGLKK